MLSALGHELFSHFQMSYVLRGVCLKVRFCCLGAGKTRGALYVLPFQMMVNVGMCVTYDVIAGQALRGVCNSLSGEGGCSIGLSVWIVVFSSAHLALALLPDISAIAWVNALGALMTVGFSVLATIGAAMAGMHRD